MRAVIDTRAWVSAVLSRGGRSAQLIQALYQGRFTVVASEPLLAEVERVLERPELITTGDARLIARTLLAALQEIAEVVPITGERRVCRDPNDDMVIETAIAGAADVLVSEDKDRSADPAETEALAEGGVRILKLGQFLDELAGGR